MAPCLVAASGTAGRLSTTSPRANTTGRLCHCRRTAFLFTFLFLLQIAIMFILVSWMNRHPLHYLTASRKNQGYIPDLELFQAASTSTRSTKYYTSAKKNNNTQSLHGKPYAYMWVIGGIHEDLAYKGFFYDVLISVYLLKERLNSTDSDFWFLAQMASDSHSDSLPEEDRRLLNEMGIQLRMLAKPSKSTSESFASVMYEKFRALELTQYRRVIFLDADTIPLVNLDYIFHLSDPLHKASPTILRPNLIMASRGEPCNGGFFMVEPKMGRWELLQSILDKNRERGKTLPYPHFSWSDGWGHNFVASGDSWDAISTKNGKYWRFHGGHTDQGLLYYYTRYAVKDVSIAMGSRVQNWYPLPGGWYEEDKAVLNEDLSNGLDPYFPGPPLEYEFNCHKPLEQQDSNMNFKCNPIFQGFAHFMGKDKPWQKGGAAPELPDNQKPTQTATNRLWFKSLDAINIRFGLGLDIQNWSTKHANIMQPSRLGYMPFFTDNARHVLNTTTSHVNNSVVIESH